MKYLLLINIFLSVLVNAQVYSLNTFPEDVPAGSYLKDYNNELLPFVGTWKANQGNKTISLQIIREEHKSFKLPNLVDIYYQDALVVKFIIKDINGNILQVNDNTQSEYDHNFIASMSVKNDIVHLYYTGTSCGIGWGTINLKRISNNQFLWSYYPNSTTLNSINCPNPSNTIIYLPEMENLVFTKQ